MSTTHSPKHKAIALIADKDINVVEVPTRSPGGDEVLIEVELASYGAADGHAVDDGFNVRSFPQIVGLVATGKALKVGENVSHVKAGDRVAAFTMPGADRATQEWVIVVGNRVTKIPEGVDPAEVTSILDNFVCAWWTLIDSLELPLPKKLPTGSAEVPIDTATSALPIVIWGAGTASAQYMIQLLRYLGYTNIIATASPRSSARAFSIGATHVVNYSDPDVAEQIVRVADSSSPIKHAVDTVATERSMKELAKIVTEPGSRVALLAPIKIGHDTDRRINGRGTAKLYMDLPREHNPFEIGVDVVPTYTFRWETNENLKATLLTSIFPQLLELGKLRSQPIRLLKSGSLLDRVKEAAELLRTNKLGGEKAIIVMKE